MTSRLFSLLMLLCIGTTSLFAIITDPEDYVYFDTGPLGDNGGYKFPGETGYFDPAYFDPYSSEEDRSNPGWSFGETSTLGSWFTDLGRKRMELSDPESNVYGMLFGGSTDTLVMNLPCCDSIYVEFWGTGGRGLRITNNKNDEEGWAGGASGRSKDLQTVGTRFRSEDSIQIRMTMTDKNKRNMFGDLTVINRIRVFGMIEQGSVPEFDGTISGWTFEYRPKESGTVDLNSHIDKVNGAEERGYTAYASDLGVIRAKLTSSKESVKLGYDEFYDAYAVRMDALGVTEAGDYTDGDTHSNYMQIAVSPVGFRDMFLDFDFAIRDGGDTCVVAYLLDGAEKWVVADKLLNSEDAWNQMKHVSLDMSVLENQNNVKIRIMMGNGEYSPNGELYVANLKLRGYDDYYPYGKNAVKIAYINNAIDRIHTMKRAVTNDSLDTYVLPKLLEDTAYNVSVITQAEWKDITEANIEERFAMYDLVVLSDFVDAESSIARAAKSLIGKKALLNLNVDVYKPTSWDWAEPVEGTMDTAVTFALNYRYHPLYLEIPFSDYTTVSFFDTIVGKTGLDGFVTSSYKGPEGYLMGSPTQAASLTVFHELNENPAAKYMLMAFNRDDVNHLNDVGYRLLQNAISYLSKKVLFVAPEFNLVSDGAIVENVEEWKAALAYDYSSRNMTEVIIRMKTSNDADQVYSLNEAMYFSPSLGNLICLPYEDQKVVVKGRLAASNGMFLQGLTFKNIVFAASDVKDALICIQAKDTILGELLIDACEIKELSGQSLIATQSATNAKIAGLSIRNSTIDGFGGVGAAQNAFICLDDAVYDLNTIAIHQNTFMNYRGGSLIASTRQQVASDTLLQYSVKNNLFYKYSGTADESGDFLYMPNALNLKASLAVENNLFYLPADGASKKYYNNIDVYAGADLSVAGNFFEPAAAAFTVSGSYQPNNLTKESLGITSVFLDEAAKSISKGSKLYSAGKDYAYVGPKGIYVAKTAPTVTTVRNVEELKVALDVAIGGDVIELESGSTDGYVYLLGSTGYPYPTTGGDLIIKAAAGHSPKLFGRLSPNNACRLDNLTYDGLTFVDSTSFEGFDKDAYSPFFLSTADTIFGAMTVKNCKFYDFDNQYVLRTSNCDGLYIGEVVYTDNYFDNMGGNRPIDGKSIGAHFIQLQTGRAYCLDKFAFRHNIVMNFHGSQFFNMAREQSTSKDSIISYSIENNLFYRLGGHTNANRNFLEFTKKPQGFEVQINIDNNIFYERISDEYYPTCYLALFEKDSAQVVDIHVRNNFFEGEYYTTDETYGHNPVALTDSPFNLPSTSTSTIEVNYEAHPTTRESLNIDDIFSDISTFSIDKTSPMYTAGTNGTYLGPRSLYGEWSAIESVSAAVWNSFYTKDGQLYIHSEKSEPIRIYNVLGKMVYQGRLTEGMNTVSGLAGNQLYVVKLGHVSRKVMM